MNDLLPLLRFDGPSLLRLGARFYSATRLDGMNGKIWLTYPLLSWLSGVLVGFKEGTDVESLSAPEVSVDGPVKGELQRTAVEAAVMRTC